MRKKYVGRRVAAAWLALAMVAGIGVALRASAGGVSLEEASCTRWVEVPLQGPSCRLPNGLWQVRLDNGDIIVTHGRDEPAETHLFWRPPAWSASDPACVTDPALEFHGVAIYARPTDRPNRFGTMAPEIREMVRYADGLLGLEAAEFGVDLDYRMRCDAGGAVTVVPVNLSTTSSAATFASIVADIGRAGHASPRAKYWVWVDVPYNLGGFGHISGDEAAVPWNANNLGPDYAVSWGARLSEGAHNLMMHENGHNMGAVQGLSPNSSGGWHCNDGQDVMCYADNGGKANYREDVCPSWMHYDCGHDDYFNPRPAPGSYLATRWNVGSPLNRFVEGCQYETGTLTGGAAGVAVEGLNTVSVPVDPACTGGRFAVSGLMEVQGVIVQGGPPDLDVCWYAAAAELRCDTASSFSTGVVPAGATSARIVLASGVNTTYVLSIV